MFSVRPATGGARRNPSILQEETRTLWQDMRARVYLFDLPEGSAASMISPYERAPTYAEQHFLLHPARLTNT